MQGRLLNLAALFVLVYATALTLSPAARLRAWTVDYRWAHWAGVAIWLAVFGLGHRETSRRIPSRDPYLLPVAAMITGWGLMTVWRVAPTFGLRQSLWLAVIGALALAGLRLDPRLTLLRRYKYLWLVGGLTLTALTLVFGTNPSGVGPRLWLGCCGVYFQPSEPLKLLLVVYLAAYLSDHQHLIPDLFSLLLPTMVMTGLALLLLLVQRDLGTASIFMVLYSGVIYAATGKRRLLLTSALALVLAGVAAYALFDVVQLRIEAWINPWEDPSGRSYQIVQSLLAVAAGGLLGRGPGLGSPTLVPVQHSDFVFASIAEEGGLAAALGLILLLSFLVARGWRAAIHARDNFRRYLAVGLTLYLGAQSILIIGGNLRLLPLTGVTLPFVSYGGSSLLAAFAALLFFLLISHHADLEPSPAPLNTPDAYLHVGGALYSGFVLIALLAGWWSFYRGPALLSRTDNPRRVIEDRFVHRGAIVDRDETPLNVTVGTRGAYERSYRQPELSATLGYNHPVYGQAGLEEQLDPILRGVTGNDPFALWWNHLLYGQSPPGLDVRLTLDLDLQEAVDARLAGHTGGAILMKSATGEILAIASHPWFNPNALAEEWAQLTQNPDAPLLNRATLGQYPLGPAVGALVLPTLLERGGLPEELPAQVSLTSGDGECALPTTEATWGAAVASGCRGAVLALGEILAPQDLRGAIEEAGLTTPPQVRLPTAAQSVPSGPIEVGSLVSGDLDWGVSPLQAALVIASLSAGGQRPAARLATAIESPEQGWVTLPALGESAQILPVTMVARTTSLLDHPDMPIWSIVAVVGGDTDTPLTWVLAGTTAGWEGTPLTMSLVLEEAAPEAGAEIVLSVLQTAMNP